MGKILQEQKKHLNQGNMNRSSRAEFLGNLGTRFKNIKAYSKKRIRTNYEKISRRGYQIPRIRFLKSRRLRKPRQHFKLTNPWVFFSCQNKYFSTVKNLSAIVRWQLCWYIDVGDGFNIGDVEDRLCWYRLVLGCHRFYISKNAPILWFWDEHYNVTITKSTTYLWQTSLRHVPYTIGPYRQRLRQATIVGHDMIWPIFYGSYILFGLILIHHIVWVPIWYCIKDKSHSQLYHMTKGLSLGITTTVPGSALRFGVTLHKMVHDLSIFDQKVSKLHNYSNQFHFKFLRCKKRCMQSIIKKLIWRVLIEKT